MSAVADTPLPPGIALRRIEVPGGPLAVHDAHPAHARGTVLLVPGFTGSKEDFRPVLEPMSEAGWRVVAVDQRGQYQSPGPDDPAAYTTDALGRDLLHLLDALDAGPVHLVGHSFGGLVSRSAVLQDPTRFLSLTLLDSGPSALSGPRVEMFPFLAPILADGGIEALWEASSSLPPHPDKPVPSEHTRDFLRRRFVAGSPAALLGMADSLTSEPDRVAELAAVDLPVLVMYGERDDAWTPDQQDEMAERLGAPVIVVTGAWHSPAAENPDLTAQVLLDWLASTSR